jgi:L-alanine-DL-glutamate epimerase-like enolase superfamily enzyme
MIEKARSLDMKIMVGCMNESMVGSSAIIHLSPLIDYLDVDGPLLLTEDVATGFKYDDGKITPAQAHGLGIELIQNIT